MMFDLARNVAIALAAIMVLLFIATAPPEA